MRFDFEGKPSIYFLLNIGFEGDDTKRGTITKKYFSNQDPEDGPAIRNRLSRSITLAEAGHGRVSVFSNRPPFRGGGII